ncbi:RNA polymerase recycling motor HelD [Jeotgalibacillus proteolyticus]|uniref:DNA helicase n=1 Tax=Jeotgalibacillus proteolyticus TaxID=2082395 RepID=A0A2S5GCE7_9BACL|nr:RNA polymerase recycling motor HelD [Jeotgalibacillus proteolyticus]PPA70573.1 DNA helicase [Jeotgalibacillus proteolyticus]
MTNQPSNSSQQHPDFKDEIDRLIFTRLYIDQALASSQKSAGSAREHLKEAFETLHSLDSSLSYMNLLTGANLLQMNTDQAKRLQNVYDKPYFARIDYQKRNEEKEQLYIGKASLHNPENQSQIIVDWRSPVANVYYDGRLGEVEYEVNDEITEGFLSLKRQYQIEKGQLLGIQDIDLTTTDELLQQSLSGNADNRLTEIVSTIQKEQNDIIRAPLNRPIIVQGAAGSGKTTIALHRISYFLYVNSETFHPSNLMILAPNKLFIEYISDVLPELGVEKIKQTTLIDYMKEAIGHNLKILDPDQKLLAMIEQNESSEELKWLSQFKGSLQFLAIVDRYLALVESSLAPKEDVMLEKFRILRGNRLRALFLDDYCYLPIYRRFDKIKGVIQNHLRTKKKTILKKIEDVYDGALEKALYGIRNDAKRRKKVTSIMDTKASRTEAIKKEARSTVRMYMKTFEKKTAIELYKELLSSKELLQAAAPELSEKEVELLMEHSMRIFSRRSFELEDLAPIYYLQGKLYGLQDEARVKSVFIDEAQDYSYFQMASLRKILDTSLFTIVGDLAQGIHSYRGMRDWHYAEKEIFKEAHYFTLQKSYRTTIEIMEAANAVLAKMEESLPLVEPVVRHGKKPVYHPISGDRMCETMEKDIEALKADGFTSIAIIGKTRAECTHIFKLFKKSTLPIQLIAEHEDLKKDRVSLLPAHLAKGLEFDAVLIPSLNEAYKNSELDRKLLYVAMTRAMHRLHLYSQTPDSLLIEGIGKIIELDDDIER